MALTEAEIRDGDLDGAGPCVFRRSTSSTTATDRAGLSQPRLRERRRDAAADVRRERHAGRRPLHDRRGAADHRRPRHHRRQPPHQHRDDRAGTRCCGPGEPLGDSAVVQSRTNLDRARVCSVASRSRRWRTPASRGATCSCRSRRRRPTTIDVGGGVEGGYCLRPTGAGGLAEDRFEADAAGSFQVGRRNLWGKNRSITLFTRVSLAPATRAGPADASRSHAGADSEQLRVSRISRARVLPRAARVSHVGRHSRVTGIIEQAIRSELQLQPSWWSRRRLGKRSLAALHA